MRWGWRIKEPGDDRVGKGGVWGWGLVLKEIGKQILFEVGIWDLESTGWGRGWGWVVLKEMSNPMLMRWGWRIK